METLLALAVLDETYLEYNKVVQQKFRCKVEHVVKRPVMRMCQPSVGTFNM